MGRTSRPSTEVVQQLGPHEWCRTRPPAPPPRHDGGGQERRNAHAPTPCRSPFRLQGDRLRCLGAAVASRAAATSTSSPCSHRLCGTRRRCSSIGACMTRRPTAMSATRQDRCRSPRPNPRTPRLNGRAARREWTRRDTAIVVYTICLCAATPAASTKTGPAASPDPQSV